MKLYLMRHGLANDISVDPEQGLSDSGQHAVQQLAERLTAKGLSFNQVFHSTKARARQTAEIMQKVLSPDASISVHNSIKPNDDTDTLIADINDWQVNTLVVSHLPFLPSVLVKLTGRSSIDISFQPATLICLKHNNHMWELEWIETA